MMQEPLAKEIDFKKLTEEGKAELCKYVKVYPAGEILGNYVAVQMKDGELCLLSSEALRAIADFIDK